MLLQDVVGRTFALQNVFKRSAARWYQPEQHSESLQNFLQQTGSLVSRVFDCLDIFGASGRVKDTWDSAGYKAVGYDLKLDLGHDIVSESGFKTLLTYGLQPLSSSYVWVILLFVCQV